MNMTPVSVPMQTSTVKASNSGSISSTSQWSAYKNTSPTSSHSSISSMSSSSSSSSHSSHHYQQQHNSISYNNFYHGNNCSPLISYNHYHQQPQQPMMPLVTRTAIPIIDPATRQVYRQPQQSTNIPPGFYNVSVC